MKIALFSDLHDYKHLGYSLFVETALNFLQYLEKYCTRNKINHIWFLGDFFHIKTRVDSIDFIRARNVIRTWRDKFDLHFLIGNHDMPLQDSTDGSIMFAFDEYGQVVENYEYLDLDNIRFHFMSYRKYGLPEFKIAKDTKNVLLMHQDMVGFKMNDAHASTEGLDLKQLRQFDLVLSGHYHLHQEQSNVVYLGAPFQTNFGERDTKKGFVVFDTEKFEWKFVQYKDAPRFKVIKYDKMEKAKVENCFVKVIVPTSIKNSAPIKDELMKRGALDVDVSSSSDEIVKELEFVEDLNKSTIRHLAVQYLNNIDMPEELNRKLLMAILDKVNDQYLSQKG